MSSLRGTHLGLLAGNVAAFAVKAALMAIQ